MSYPNVFEFQEDFEKGEQILGKGTYGTVYKKKSKRIINNELENANSGQGQYFAVKMMEAQTERSFATIQKEFLILRSLPKQHPNIIKLYKTYAWANQLTKTYTLMLVMELADKSLMREIEERSLTKNYFQDDELHHIFLQCIQTLEDIKTLTNIYHRDIKPENILLIKSGFQIKLADFGVSKKLIKEKLTTIAGTLVGTPSYLSPVLWEAFQQGQQQIQKINKITHNLEKSDVFSLGVTLLQTTLLTCDIQHLNQRNIGEAKTNELLKQVQNPRIRNILAKMLIHDEKLRAPYSELINLLKEPIPKPIGQAKKPIFSHVEPKQGIKEKFSLQAKLQYDKIEQTQQETEELETNKAEQPKDDGSQNLQTQQIQRSQFYDQEQQQQEL